MAVAAGTTFSVAVQIRTGRADQEEIGSRLLSEPQHPLL